MDFNEKAERISYLVQYLNKCCDEYYNQNSPSLSDAQYDKLFDELSELEKQTGMILENSPTQRAGYEVMSELKKVVHSIPLLSLAKTKSAAEVLKMAKQKGGYLGLKMDGLTVKLTYENGKLVQAATRGDGEEGEDITHNAKVFVNIPKTVDFANTLEISGEAYIDIQTFDYINEQIDNDEDKYSTPRNLASGSVRQLDSRICKQRRVKFMPFCVLNGMDDIPLKSKRLDELVKMGFDRLECLFLDSDDDIASTQKKIDELKSVAMEKGYPVDGIVFTYDDAEFSKEQGRTSHHFKDGIAYKFGDPSFETTLRKIVWNISRTGQLTPIAEFDAVEIDNTNVERASLHNMTFIEGLRLKIGNRILVSKRNMIIPHIEQNLDYENGVEYAVDYPEICPICSGKTTVRITETDVKALYCENSDCAGKQIKKYTHFVSKQAMNIDGLSEATITKFIKNSWLKTVPDIYRLNEYKDEITAMEGFGEKSYNNLVDSIEKSKNTKLSNFLTALNIPLLGKSAAKLIEDTFGNVDDFVNALEQKYDFSQIPGFGETINREIYGWFSNEQNREEFESLLKILNIKAVENTADKNGKFFGKTVVITGTFENYTRDELTEKMQSLGAKVSGSVSKKTDFLLAGEKAGSKLSKAQQLGVDIIYEQDLSFE